MMKYFLLIALFVSVNVFGQGNKEVRHSIGCIQKRVVLNLKKGKHMNFEQNCSSCISISEGKIINILNLEDSVYTVEVQSGKKKIYYSNLVKLFVTKDMNIKKGAIIGSLEKDKKTCLYYLDVFISDSKGEIAYQSLD